MDFELDKKNRRFFVNLKAGKGMSEKGVSLLKWEVERMGKSLDVVIPKSREHTESEVSKFLSEGGEEVVVIGGDGTINSVVNSLCHNGKKYEKKPALYVGHYGTGNDYFRSLVLGREKCDWKSILKIGEKCEVDVGKITFEDNTTKYFVNMSSVGLAPQIVKEKEKLPWWIPSKLKYLVPSLKTFLTFKAFPVELVIDGKSHHYNAKAVTFSKGTFAGGGMRFGESVKLDDGELEITVFEEMNPVTMIYHFSKLYDYSKSINGVDGIVKFKAKRVEIKSSEKIPVEFDGELYGSTNLVVEVCPKKLTVYRPPREKSE